MSSFAGPKPIRPGDVAGTLRLLAYLALAIGLMVVDHRADWLAQVRAQAGVAVQPLWWLAALPSRLGESVRDDAATRTRLAEENRRLRNELLVGSAREARLRVEAEENTRLRGLLGAAERGGLDVQLAPVLDVDLDPTRQRLLLNAGSRDGARMGQSVIDAGGLLGQIIEVTPSSSTVLLLTDPDHAVPVTIARTGVRLVLYGSGRTDLLVLPNVPLSGDVRAGDVLVTSGLGGRFPAGFPVGTIRELRPDDSRAFLLGEVTPAAQLDRGRDVLLLRDVRATTTAAPVDGQAPATDAPADGAASPATGSGTAPSAVPAANAEGPAGANGPAPTATGAASDRHAEASRTGAPASASTRQPTRDAAAPVAAPRTPAPASSTSTSPADTPTPEPRR